MKNSDNIIPLTWNPIVKFGICIRNLDSIIEQSKIGHLYVLKKVTYKTYIPYLITLEDDTFYSELLKSEFYMIVR